MEKLLKIFGKLPGWWHYGVSDYVLYPLMYHVARYRRRVVRENLRLSFPERNEQEIKRIEKAFYHHLCDVLVEIIWAYGMTEEEMREHIEILGTEEIARLTSQYGSTICMATHLGNWEWQAEVQRELHNYNITQVNVYKQQHSAWADRLMLALREHHGGACIEKRQVLRQMIRYRNEGKHIIYGLLSDQKPRPETTKFTNTFLHQETGWMNGSEVLSKKFDFPVMYLHMAKLSRGHYRITVKTLCEHPGETKPGEIMEMYSKTLEENIMEQPELWLWSHDRWHWTRKRN